MTISRLCDATLVYCRNPKAVRRLPCGKKNHECLPDNAEYDWCLLADLVMDHPFSTYTRLLCAQFIRYFSARCYGLLPWSNEKVEVPVKDCDPESVWGLVNNCILAPKDPEGELPQELRPATYKMHYRKLQDAQYNIGESVQMRNTPKSFPKTVSAGYIIEDKGRLSYDEQRKRYLEAMDRLCLEMTSNKASRQQFEYVGLDGLGFNGFSFITEVPITINPGIHYEQWSSGDRKCVRTLQVKSENFVLQKQDMKLGMSVWPLVRSDMAVITCVGMFVTMLTFVLKKVGTKDFPVKQYDAMEPFCKKISELLFGKNDSPVYKNTFVGIKLPFAVDGMKQFSGAAMDEYKEPLAEHQVQEERARDANYCASIRLFPRNNIVEPTFNLNDGTRFDVQYEPLWSMQDIGTSLQTVYRGFVQMSMEPVLHQGRITVRLQFANGIIKPLKTDYGSLNSSVKMEDMDEEARAFVEQLLEAEKERLQTLQEAFSVKSPEALNSVISAVLNSSDFSDDDDSPPPKKFKENDDDDDETPESPKS